jgi:hypothetical protein
VAGQHGGYRKPNNPAPTSPPGALSRRTDGGPATQPQMVAPGGAYGERSEMQSIQGGAAMQGTTPAPALTPLGAPTADPSEPITAGADLGPGVGPQADGIQSDQQVTNEQLRPLLRSLELVANLPGSNAETRTFVRQLKARLGA